MFSKESKMVGGFARKESRFGKERKTVGILARFGKETKT
jgi:hypothetical protein